MARLHEQTHTTGQRDSHCRVIDSHDLHHADDTNHAGYQQLTIKNIKHLKEKREMMIKLVNPDCDAATTCRIYELQDGEIHNLPMKRFVGHTEIEEDGLQICLYFPNMSEKTREKFVEAFND